jgi:transcription elongation GreA/GreB family factor
MLVDYKRDPRITHVIRTCNIFFHAHHFSCPCGGSDGHASPVCVNKQAVLDQILSVLNAELTALTRAASGAFAAATDPDSKAENKYDTRNLEASYVARGQAKRVTELQEAVRAFEALPGHALGANASVTMGALVSLEAADGRFYYFIGPFAGGTEIEHAGHEIVVITPASALGQKLMTKKAGDEVLLRPGASARIAAVK